jgi:hypothetical protein
MSFPLEVEPPRALPRATEFTAGSKWVNPKARLASGPYFQIRLSPRAGEAPDADLPDYDSLAEVLSEAAATKEGTAECQTIRVYRPAGSLIITRPLVVHRRIEKLLRELRQARIDQ